MSELGNKDIFAKNLSYYMEKKQVDRYQLCEALDFKYSTLCEWLSAKKYPRIDKIEKMANYFGIPKSALIEKSEPVKTDPLSEFKLSAKQRELLEMLLTLDQETLDKTLDFARFLLSQRDKNE